MAAAGGARARRAVVLELIEALESTVPESRARYAVRLAVIRAESAALSDAALAERLAPVLRRLQAAVEHPDRIGGYPQVDMARQCLTVLSDALR